MQRYELRFFREPDLERNQEKWWVVCVDHDTRETYHSCVLESCPDLVIYANTEDLIKDRALLLHDAVERFLLELPVEILEVVEKDWERELADFYIRTLRDDQWARQHAIPSKPVRAPLSWTDEMFDPLSILREGTAEDQGEVRRMIESLKNDLQRHL